MRKFENSIIECMHGKRLLAGGVCVLVAAVAAGAVWMWRRKAPPARPVAAQPAVARFTGREVALPGRIRAQSVLPVAAPIEGTVESAEVDAGDAVYEGQLLARIKNTGLEAEEQAATAELERAQARVEKGEAEVLELRADASRAQADAARAQTEFDRAQAAYLRQQTLDREGATPHQVFTKALAQFESAKAGRDAQAEFASASSARYTAAMRNLDTLRQVVSERSRALDETRERAALAEVHAPADGLVLARARNVGEEVTTSLADLFQIAVNLSSLEAVVQPDPPVLARIRAGQEAILTFADLPDALPGAVKGINGTEVVVEFTSPNPAVRPGMTAEVRIRLE